MSKYVVLHDRRVWGGVPFRRGLKIIKTDERTPLVQSFRMIREYAQHGLIHTLFIICHGYAGEDPRAMVSIDGGGLGLELGREGLFLWNVSRWRMIQSRVHNIVVHACAAGDTQPGNRYTYADGRQLMGMLALHTRASVFAAERIQRYDIDRDVPRGRMDFGDWEGPLLKFAPACQAPIPGTRAPVELGDVMKGIAP